MTITVFGRVRKMWRKNHLARPTLVRQTTLGRVSPGAQSLYIALVVLLILMLGSDVMAETTDVIQVDSVLIRLIDQVEVPARAAGVLSAIHVVAGQVVEKEKLLAQIDDVEARLIGQRAKIELKIARENATDDVAVRSARKAGVFARSEQERLERAASELSGSVLKSELEEAELHCEQAQLNLERAQRDLHLIALTQELKENELLMSARNVQLCKVKAPLGGVVVQVLRRPGEWVQSGDKVVRIVRMDRLRAEGFVQARDVVEGMLGASATVLLDLPGGPPMQFAGEVVFVSPEINPVSGQVRVWVEVDNPRRLLKPGMRATMTIAANPGDALTFDNLQVDPVP